MRVLFSKGPFIAIFASDPHIIIKAINQNLNSVLRDSNINGHDYMRNIVHLPVFLNSRGLSNAKKLMVASTTNGDIPYADSAGKVLQESGMSITKPVIQNLCFGRNCLNN